MDKEQIEATLFIASSSPKAEPEPERSSYKYEPLF